MREAGFYWVCVFPSDEWLVAYYSLISDSWEITGSKHSFRTYDLCEIDERRIVREVE